MYEWHDIDLMEIKEIKKYTNTSVFHGNIYVAWKENQDLILHTTV
jgi:hypothetical protein